MSERDEGNPDSSEISRSEEALPPESGAGTLADLEADEQNLETVELS